MHTAKILKVRKNLDGREVKAKRQLHRHPFIIPVITFFVLLIFTAGLFINYNGNTIGPNDAHIVILKSDKKQQSIPTRAATVGEFLGNAGVAIHDGDVVEPSTDTRIFDDNFRVNVYRAKPVALIDGQHKTFALSAAVTPRSIATQAGVKVYPEDNLKIEPTEHFIRDGSIGPKVAIQRATPASVNLYGTAVNLRTQAKTVGELLKEKKVQLAKDDTVQPSLDTPVKSDTPIFVTRFGTQIATSEESIPMPKETVEDPSLSFGATAVRQQGTPGKKLVTYQIELKNNQEVARHLIQEVVTQEPVKQITARGKAINIATDKESIMAAAGISPSDYAYVNYIVTHEGGWGGTTRYNSAGSGAYGLCQALPGSKMASAGADWQTNPVTQLRWCSGYAAGRFGGWAGAYNYWLAHNNW